VDSDLTREAQRLDDRIDRTQEWVSRHESTLYRGENGTPSVLSRLDLLDQVIFPEGAAPLVVRLDRLESSISALRRIAWALFFPALGSFVLQALGLAR
jgi:hypothetical protein